MFENIGEKIMSLAKATCCLAIIFCWLLAIIYCANDRAIIGIVIGAVGSVLCWASSFVLYGFGELIDTNKKILEELRKDKSI